MLNTAVPSRSGNRDARIGFAKRVRIEISVGVSRSSRRGPHFIHRRPLAHQPLELLHLGLTDHGKLPHHLAVEDEHLGHGSSTTNPRPTSCSKISMKPLCDLCGSALFVSSRLLKTLISTAGAKTTWDIKLNAAGRLPPHPPPHNRTEPGRRRPADFP